MSAARRREVGEPGRFSRYHCKSKSAQPQSLEAILKFFLRDKDVRRRGFLTSKNDVRAVLARADQYYKEIGKADDLMRFLLNTGALINDEQGYWFDEPRGVYILDCCSKGTEPELPEGTVAERVLAIKAARLKAIEENDEIEETVTSQPMPVVVPIESLSALPSPPGATDIGCYLHSAEELEKLDDACLDHVQAQSDMMQEHILNQRSRITFERKRRTEERLAEEQRRLDAEIADAEEEAKRIASE